MYGTARQVYIDVLTELNKEEAPTMYLEDFLYYYNKAISEYLKARYELFETTQQITDDLRAWKKEFISTKLEINVDDICKTDNDNNKISEYRHLLGCIITINIKKPITRCDQRPGVPKQYKVTRMSSDIKSGLLNNSYLEPKFYRPYFEVLNNKVKIDIGDVNTQVVNVTEVVIEYLTHPAYVDLTEEEVDYLPEEGQTIEDISQVLEFSTDVGEEITKIALKLILERGSSPRMQSHVAVNQSISDISTGMRGGK